jgi:predicted dehydrogenase
VLRFLLGEIKRTVAFQSNSGAYQGADIEDSAVACFEFESGTIGEIAMLFVPSGAVFPEQWIFYGTEGIVHNVGGWQMCSKTTTETVGEFTKLDLPGVYSFGDSFANEIKHFLECVRDGKEPVTSVEDNLKTLAVVMAIYRSAETKRVVDVDEILKQAWEQASLEKGQGE